MPTLLIGYERNTTPPMDDAWDALLDRAKTEIMDDIAKGLPVQCNGYVIDPNDFFCFVSERPEAELHMLAFMAGHLSGEDYRKWHGVQLEAYADRHAESLANYRKAEQAQYAAETRADFMEDM